MAVFMQNYIGLMSGTSLDAIDAVLVELDHHHCYQVRSVSHPIPPYLKQSLLELTLPGKNEIEKLAIAEPAFAKECAQAVKQLLYLTQLSPSDITAIGSHGQTIRHRPEKGFTLQIGDPSLIAELTGITVVADFRRRDVAAGGHGAPLVPAFHHSVFANENESRVIVNIGGMANITILSNKPATGFDTGPGNILMDTWCQQHLNQPYDKNGQWAGSSDHNPELLKLLLKDPYFHQPPPKSTGRELFNSDWLKRILTSHSTLEKGISSAVIQSTLCQLTATSIAQDINRYAPTTHGIYLCGGGVHNRILTGRLKQLLPNKSIQTTKSLGIAPDWVEAVAFAWLARQTLEHRPGNLPEVTGAKGPRILGGIYSA